MQIQCPELSWKITISTWNSYGKLPYPASQVEEYGKKPAVSRGKFTDPVAEIIVLGYFSAGYGEFSRRFPQDLFFRIIDLESYPAGITVETAGSTPMLSTNNIENLGNQRNTAKVFLNRIPPPISSKLPTLPSLSRRKRSETASRIRQSPAQYCP